MHKRTDLPEGLGFYYNGSNPNIYVSLWIAEKRHTFSTGTTSVKEAKAFRTAKIQELGNEHVATKKGVRVSDLFADYIAHLKRNEDDQGTYATGGRTTSDRTEGSMKNLVEPFGKLKPEAITTDRLNKYKDDRRKAGASVVTINRELGYLRTALRLGTKTTPPKVKPAFLLQLSFPINVEAEKRAARTGTISQEQYETLMGHLAPHLKPILAVTMFTGIRPKELKFIRAEQVDFDARRIELRVGETKNGKARTEPINDHVFEILKSWADQTQAEYPNAKYFFHYKGEQLGDGKTAWYAALERAGLTGKIIFYDARRSAATFNDRIGVSEADNQKMMGHSSKEMTRRYSQHESTERVRLAQNEELNRKATVPTAVAPASSVRDWKDELRELKALMDDGILTADEFAGEKARVLAGRG
jgi:integrase